MHLWLKLTALAPPREGDRNAPISQNHNAGRAPPPLRAEGGITNEWQNLPIVHDLRAPDGKRGPSGQDIREMYSLTAFFTPLRIHRKQILPKSADFACISATSCHEGAFFPSGALSEYIAMKYCHSLPLRNALRRYLAQKDVFRLRENTQWLFLARIHPVLMRKKGGPHDAVLLPSGQSGPI